MAISVRFFAKVKFVMANADIEQLIEDVIEREGSYVDHPTDRGGSTSWGITEAVVRRQGYMDDMRCLPQNVAAAIYKQLYWLVPAFDKVAETASKLAEELLDTAGDYGESEVNRRIGPATLLALNTLMRRRGKCGEEVLLKAVEAMQGAHYVRLAETRPLQEAIVYECLANRIG